MSHLSNLPKKFSELINNLPEGYYLSARVLEPIVILDKYGSDIKISLGGISNTRKGSHIFHAPSNYHSWVVDQKNFRPLPNDAVSIFHEITNGFDLDKIKFSDAIKLLRSTDSLIRILATDNFLLKGELASNSLDCEIAIPNLNATLYPYQARGVKWLWDTINYTGGAILADEMGLGKTLQIIALLLIEPPQIDAPALIICPTSLITNWVREFDRFAEGITILVHRGVNRSGVYKELTKNHVVITTYDTVINDISMFTSFKWSWLVCDEAQLLKNPDSSRRKIIGSLPRKNTIPMTGTPVENSLLDLWSLVDLAIPGLLGNRNEFEINYPDGLHSAQEIVCLIDPIILKRRVADVAKDLPERIDIDVPLELTDDLVEHYINVQLRTLEKYPVAGALVATLQLQLVCAHPWLRNVDERDVDGENSKIERTTRYSKMTPKIQYLVGILNECFQNNKKVIVFSIFNRIGEIIKECQFEDSSTYWGAINGSTPQEKRQLIIDEFSSYTGPGCLILNPKAAGSGLNITAATVVIHFTPVWNPAIEAQASARAHRRGQTEPVTIYRLFYKDTVEEVMIERSIFKRELANESIPVSIRDESDIRRAITISPRKMI
jgi:SNF2 family DNA or RNA helicase